MSANLYLCRKCTHLDVRHSVLSSDDKERRKEDGDETCDWYWCTQHANEAAPDDHVDFNKHEDLIGWIYFESHTINVNIGFKFPKKCPYILEHTVDPFNEGIEEDEDYQI